MLVNKMAKLMATYAATSMACPADLKPGTFRTSRFLTSLVWSASEPPKPDDQEGLRVPRGSNEGAAQKSSRRL